jgi:hypothetical protein
MVFYMNKARILGYIAALAVVIIAITVVGGD